MSGDAPSPSPIPRTARLQAAALIALAVEGVLALSLAPQIVLGLEASGISTAMAGYCMSLNFGAMMLGSVLVYFWKDRLSAFAWALVSLALLITGYLGAAGGGLGPVLVGLSVNGLGAGFTSIAFAYLAQGSATGRNFAIYNFASMVVDAAVGYVAARHLESHGIAILFYFCAAVGLGVLPLMWSLPHDRSRDLCRRVEGSIVQAIPRSRSLLICSMMIFYYTAFSAAWTFAGDFGRFAALSEQQSSEYIAVITLLSGLVATAVVLAADAAIRPAVILRLLLVAQLGTVALMIFGHGVMPFVAAVFCLNAFHSIIFPQNMNLVGRIDGTGRLAVLASIVQSLAFALGPALCGPVFQRAGSLGYGLFCASGIVLALICLSPSFADKRVISTTLGAEQNG